MHEPMLIFETDPQLGTPKLTAVNGAAKTWTLRDLGLLEDELRTRYSGLVCDGAGTILFNGKILHVKKKDGDTTRQPTLELRSAPWSAPPPAPKPFALPKPAAPDVDWGKRFLAEIDRLFASDRFNGIPPTEKAMLKLVREELATLVEKTPSTDLALLALVSILMTAEHVCRTQRPSEPRPYAYALSGIERLLSEKTASPQTPWGRLPTHPSPEPAPSWLGRFWSRMTGDG